MRGAFTLLLVLLVPDQSIALTTGYTTGFSNRFNKNVPIQTYQWFFQDNAVFGDDFWERNFTILGDYQSHGCYGTRDADLRPESLAPLNYMLPDTQGTIVWVAVDGSPCTIAEQIRAWNNKTDILIAANRYRSDQLVVDYSKYRYQVGDPAFLFVGPYDYTDMITRNQNRNTAPDPDPQDYLKDVMFGGDNATMTGINSPRPVKFTGTMRAIETPGSLPSFAIYFGVYSGIFLMLLAVFKYTQFYTLSGKIEFSIPQVVIAISFVASFLLWFSNNYNIFQPHPISYDVKVFWKDLIWPFLWTAVIVMGFYFREVSILTGSSTGLGLDKLRIPAAVTLIIIWGVFFGITVFFAADPEYFIESYWEDRSNSIYQLDAIENARGGIAMVAAAVCVAILLFGSISLLLQLAPLSSNRKSMIVRIVVMSAVIVIFIIIFSILGFIDSWADRGTTGDLRCNDACSQATDEVMWTYMWANFHHIGVILCLLLSFRVVVSQEIEVSASATTSGSSSGSASSSSSGSSGDPVIEL